MVVPSSESIPLWLLKKAIKVTVESPSSVKDNLFKIYESVNEEEYNEYSQQFLQAFFHLALFHCVVV